MMNPANIMKIINFGSLNIDKVCSVEEFVQPGETIMATGYSVNAGGKGLNQSVAAARAGAQVLHAGAVGSDGLFLKEILADAGADFSCLLVMDTESGCAFIEVNSKGQNRIIVSAGTNRMYTEEYIKNVLEKAEAGDSGAFAQLIRMNTQSMYKVAWAYLKNDEDVADAIQETILKCYEKLSTLKKDSYFKTWMIRILINNCNEMLRHKGRVFPTMEMEEGIFEESGYVDCEWKEILASLEEKYQVVMLLYYSKSLSVKEIAALLEISQNTVLTRLSRARKQLRAEYEGGYIHG